MLFGFAVRDIGDLAVLEVNGDSAVAELAARAGKGIWRLLNVKTIRIPITCFCCSMALLCFPAQAPECGQLRAQDKDDSAVAALAAGGGDAVREAALLESWKAYKRGFQQGIALFNAKPKKGVAFLQARPPAYHTLLSTPMWASLPFCRPHSKRCGRFICHGFAFLCNTDRAMR